MANLSQLPESAAPPTRETPDDLAYSDALKGNNLDQEKIKAALAYTKVLLAYIPQAKRDIWITQPCLLAELLLQYTNADTDAVCAAILYPFMRHDVWDRFDESHLNIIKDWVGGAVTKTISRTCCLSGLELVDMPENIESVADFDGIDQEQEGAIQKFRIMAILVTKDRTALAIRMIQWLAQLMAVETNIQQQSGEEKQALLKQLFYTKRIYGPLTEMGGFYNLYQDMMRAYFSRVEPDWYAAIHNFIEYKVYNGLGENAQTIIPEIKKAIEETLVKAGFDKARFKIEVRVKSEESIWQKMKKKGLKLDDLEAHIYDFLAARVIFDPLYGYTGTDKEAQDAMHGFDIALCDAAYKACVKEENGHFTKHKGEETLYNDYHKKPKENGYRALHGSVKYLEKILEMQFLTKRWHRDNTLGFPAHAGYKHGLLGTGFTLGQFWKRKGKIFVWGAEGKIFQLAKKSTIADFAKAVMLEHDSTSLTIKKPSDVIGYIERIDEFGRKKKWTCAPGSKELANGDVVWRVSIPGYPAPACLLPDTAATPQPS